MRLLVLVVALLGAACAYPLPAAPTPITDTPVAAPPAIAIEVLPGSSVDFATGTAQIGVRARAADGTLTRADVTCTATSGRLLPARFDPFLRPGTELALTTVPTRVTCAAGALQDRVDVDMSAWSIDLLGHDWVGRGAGAGESRVTLGSRQRIARIPVTGLTIAWGDGTVEPWPFVPLETPGTRIHRYARAGLYTVTARIEWPEGVFERRFSLPGGPPLH